MSLTDKAKVAIEEKIDLSKKRKNTASGANAGQSKKAKPTQGHAKDMSSEPEPEDTTNVSPPRSATPTVPTPALAVPHSRHHTVVCTEEEEAELYANADVIDDLDDSDSADDGSAPRELSPDVETVEDELSNTKHFNLYTLLMKP
jgi:hypothetical protein